MKHGDILVKVDDVLTVTFQGYVAGELCSYNIEFDIPGGDFGHYKPCKSTVKFTGTVADTLQHTAYLIQEYNRTLTSRGGGLLI